MIFVNLWGYNPYSRNSQCKGPVVRALFGSLKDHLEVSGASQVELVVKNPPTNAGDSKRHGFNPWVGKIPLEEGLATHSSILAWRIPWTEELGGLQCMG